jgi:Acetyltransferase (GNAT) domain/Acetyltransferase (GNAT) family
MAREDQPDLAIRPMTRAELDLALEWAAGEGWNPGLADADPFYAADPQGFLMAFRQGEPVASISVVRYDQTFGFLGLYLVRRDVRGRGYGWTLWNAGMRYLERCVVGLDGVVAQQANYARSGFRLAHRNIRYAGSVVLHGPASESRIRRIDETLVDAVVAYDRMFFPVSRASFLSAWLDRQQRTAVAFLEEGHVRGYGVIRACRTGFKIGPLFADTEEIADELFRSLAVEAVSGPVFLDVPEPNPSAVGLAARYGLTPVFETARMYRGRAPVLPLGATYGITTFELG